MIGILVLVIALILILMLILHIQNKDVINEYSRINLKGNEDINDINTILSHKLYENVNNDKMISFYLIIIDKRELEIKQQIISFNNNQEKMINIPNSCDFILSFHRNVNIPYTWNMFSNQTDEVIKLKDVSIIDCIEDNSKAIEGVSNDRQNFYFETIKEGEQSLTFEYLPNNSRVVKTMIKKLNIVININ